MGTKLKTTLLAVQLALVIGLLSFITPTTLSSDKIGVVIAGICITVTLLTWLLIVVFELINVVSNKIK